MEMNKVTVLIEQTNDECAFQPISELKDSDLVLVGGGGGDVVFH